MKTADFSFFLLKVLAIFTMTGGLAHAQAINYTFDQIESEWNKVYPDNSPILRNVFNKYIDNGAIFTDDSASSTGATPGAVVGGLPGKPEVKIRFPIKNFDAESLEAYLGGQARIQLLKNTLNYYVGAREDSYRMIEKKKPEEIEQLYQYRKQAVESMKLSVNLELFVLQLAGYARSSSLTQRCNFWRLAKNIAIDLQFADGGSPVFALGGQTWLEYYKKAQTFYNSSTGYARIPAEICSLSVVNGRADTLSAIQQAIDSEIAATMQNAVESFKTVLENRNQELGMQMSKSEIIIPARGLYTLERGFKDTFDLMNLVDSDLIGLYSSQNGESLIARLKKQIDQMNTGDAERNARQQVNTFVLIYGNLLSRLSLMPDTQGLSPVSKGRLEVCRALQPAPDERTSAGDIARFQTSYNSCLRSLVSEYKAMRQSKKDDPMTLKFAESLSSLVSFYKAKI